MHHVRIAGLLEYLVCRDPVPSALAVGTGQPGTGHDVARSEHGPRGRILVAGKPALVPQDDGRD